MAPTSERVSCDNLRRNQFDHGLRNKVQVVLEKRLVWQLLQFGQCTVLGVDSSKSERGASVRNTVFSLDSVILDSSWAGHSLTCIRCRTKSSNLIANCRAGMCLNLTLEDVVDQRVSLLVSALFVKVPHQPQLKLGTGKLLAIRPSTIQAEISTKRRRQQDPSA